MCAPSETKLLLREWQADDLEELKELCDFWLLDEPEPAQDAALGTQQPEQPPPRPFPRVAPDASARRAPPLALAACTVAVALQPAAAPLASPFSAASLQTPLIAPPQPAQRTRPRLTSSSQALSWVLAMGKLAESQGVAATPPLACPWEAAALPSRPPSPPSAQHAADLPAPRPTHSSRSLEHSSSGSVAAENGSPVLCTAEEPSHSLDLLDLLGADPMPPRQLAPRSRVLAAGAAPYRGIGAYGEQRSAPLLQLAPCGGGYERLPAAGALPTAQESSAAGLHRAASATIGRKRLCTWDEHPEAECGLAPRRSLPAPPLPPAWQQAQQLSAPLPPAWQPPPERQLSATLPPAWQQAQLQQQPSAPLHTWQQPPPARQSSAPLPTWHQVQLQRQPSLEDGFEAQRQRLSSLLAQLQQVRAALQQEAAPLPLPPRHLAPAAAPVPQLQHHVAPPAAPAAATLHHQGLQAGHLSWNGGASWRVPSPFNY